MNDNDKQTLSLVKEYNKEREAFNDKIKDLNDKAKEILAQAVALAEKEGFSFSWDFGSNLPNRHYSVGNDFNRRDIKSMIRNTEEFQWTPHQGYGHREIEKFYSLTAMDSNEPSWEEWNTSSLEC